MSASKVGKGRAEGKEEEEEEENTCGTELRKSSLDKGVNGVVQKQPFEFKPPFFALRIKCLFLGICRECIM